MPISIYNCGPPSKTQTPWPTPVPQFSTTIPPALKSQAMLLTHAAVPLTQPNSHSTLTTENVAPTEAWNFSDHANLLVLWKKSVSLQVCFDFQCLADFDNSSISVSSSAVWRNGPTWAIMTLFMYYLSLYVKLSFSLECLSLKILYCLFNLLYCSRESSFSITKITQKNYFLYFKSSKSYTTPILLPYC